MNRSKLILLVEDDAVVMVVKSHAIKKEHYDVKGVSSGEEAIRILNKGELPELVLMDINLGAGMTGLDAAKEIVKITDVPILFLSSISDDKHIEEALRISPYGYVLKDSPNPVLLASIKLAIGLHHAKKELKLKEDEIKLNEQRLQGLARITQHPAESTKEFLDFALDEAILLTQSKIGYIYFYSEEKKEFTLNSWSKDVMEECSIDPAPTLYQLDQTGYWGEAVRQRKPIVNNHFLSAHPHKKGYPEGHVALYRFLTIPVIFDGKIVAVVGVANKDSDYLDSDILQLQLMMSYVWKYVRNRQAYDKIIRLSTAIEHSPSSIVITDTSGIIEYVNPKFTQVTGYDVAEAIGKNPRILKAGITPPEEYEMLWKTITAGKEWIGEFCNKRKNGELYFEKASISPVMDYKGNIISYIAVKEDITEQKKYVEQLKLLNATKDKFFSIIAHDLKNPFVGLLGLTELLLDNYENFSPEETMASLTMIRKSASNGFELLKNLLDWSLANSGNINFVPEKLILKTIIINNLQLLEQFASSKAITITSKVEEQTEVIADLNMVNVIFRNLLSNAIKYTNKGGEIEINAIPQKDLILISVKDNGIGINKENLGKLFRIDAQFSMAGTEKEQGTGLGLILCNEFAERQGGKLWVESEPGEGSTFFFTLPISK